MKKIILSMLYLLAPIVMMAQANVVKQPQFGKQTIIVPIGEELTFYDHKGTEQIKDSYLNNAQSLTVFRPANSDYVVEILFEKFDLKNGDDKPYDTTAWHGFVKIYNGICDADNSFTWETDVYGVTERPNLPDGDVIEVLCGNYTNKTIMSSSADGTISVGLLYKRGATCDGWTAKVRCIKPERMNSTSAGTYYNYVDTNPRKKDNLTLANFFIDTEGELNADYLKEIHFSLPLNENVVNPTSIRLQTKDQSDSQASISIPVTTQLIGNEYVMTLNHKLEKGHNTFTLIADFLNDAKAGSKVEMNITSLNTLYKPNGITQFEANTPATVFCPGIICMPKDSTVIVGDYPLDFFDDGGLEGDATPYFVGKVTFLPETPGKAVEIDFTRVRLFPAPAEGGYGQYIRVYNGTSADESRFLREVKSYQQEKITSSSPDGALTVTYESTVSAKDEGFEAKVKQVGTVPMSVEKIKTTQITGNSVSPEEKDVEMLRIVISTQNTLPALAVNNFKFSANGTSDNIARASLYYTLASYDARKDIKLGEVDVTSDEFVINVDDGFTLIEGDNVFWLTIDVEQGIENGQRIDVQALSVAINNVDMIIGDGNPFGDRLVMHTVLSTRDQGIVRSVVNESLTFKNRGFMDLYDSYEWGDDERTNVFTPKHEGMSCRIDFSQFELFYASADDGARASFEIYSGDNPQTGELLWKVNNQNDAFNGPEGAIISTAADGCLTIVFNPHADKFSLTSKGFIAEVSEIDAKAPTISFNHELLTTYPGGSVTVQAFISGGEKPYKVECLNGKRLLVDSKTQNEEYASFVFNPTICDDYLFRVIDTNGRSVERQFRVVVLDEPQTADFENLYLTEESYWCGTSRDGSFVSGSYEFSNGYIPEWNYWHGFAYSNQTSTSYENMIPDEFNSAAGGGYNGSENFAVVYVDDLRIRPLHKKSAIIDGFYVTNDAWVVNAILNGDGMTDGVFSKGDHLRLRIKGLHSDGTENYIDYYLADYHSDDEANHYYLDSWQWVDTKALGEIVEMTFEMGSTKGNLYGMTTPAFFCMDNFNGKREETIINLQTGNEPIDINQYFSFEHPTASITYSLPDGYQNGVSLTEDGILTTQPYQELNIVVCGKQRGKQQFVRFMIGDATHITSTVHNNEQSTTIYTLDGRCANTLQKGFNIIHREDGTITKIIKR